MKGTAALVLAAGVIASLVAPSISSARGGGPAERNLGERAFQKCYACHTLDESNVALQGPALNDIVGRAVAAEPDFSYSPAILSYAQRQPRWTREALDAFLADPQGVVPDNDMGFFGISDEAERTALINYLATR